MRALGYRTVDALVDWLSDDSRPPLRRATPAEMAERLGVPVPTAGAPFDEALAVLFDDVLPFTSRSSHTPDSSRTSRSPALAADDAAGRLAFLVVANGGATSTGAVDPIRSLAELCRERNIWLHVDAAYGGFSVLTARGRAALDGLDAADSISSILTNGSTSRTSAAACSCGTDARCDMRSRHSPTTCATPRPAAES